MKKLSTLVCLGLLLSALFAHGIPYPVDSKDYQDYKQSLIGKHIAPPVTAAANSIMQALEYRQETRNGLLVPVDSTFTLALSGNDDSSTEAIPLPFTFDFYGSPQTEFYINNNGNISFGESYSTFSSTGFPINEFPMFAAFWADVDTRPAASGKVYYRVEANRVVVTWHKVGYYSNHTNLQNTFQIIFSDSTDPLIGIGNNIAFSYADMQWTTGDASGGSGGFGGVPATVGLNKGNGIEYALIGRFDHAGTDYNGPGGSPSGVSYLDNQLFVFSAQGMALAPFFTGIPGSVVNMRVGDRRTLIIAANSANLESYVEAFVNHDLPSGVSYTISPGNPCQIQIDIEARLDNRGTHTIQLEALDNNDPPQSTSTSISVNISGSLQDFLLVADYTNAAINLVDIATNQVYGPFLQGQIGTGQTLDIVIAADASFALISSFLTNRIYQIDLSDPLAPVVSANYYLGFAAEDICLSLNDRYALVADGGNSTSLAVLDLQSRTTIQVLNISPHCAQGIEISPHGRVLVNDRTNGQLHQYSLNENTGVLSYSGISIPIPQCMNTVIHPSGKYAVACDFAGSIKVLELGANNSLNILQSIECYGPQSAVYAADGSMVIIGTLGVEHDALLVYDVDESGMLVFREQYELPRVSDAGFYGVETVALSADKNKAYISSFTQDMMQDLYAIDLITHTMQGIELSNPSGICIGSPKPKPYFVANVTQYSDHAVVSFENLSRGTPDTWRWNFGDGQSSTEWNPTHIYSDPGSFVPTLTLTKGSHSASFSHPIQSIFNTDIHITLADSPYYVYNDLYIGEDSSLLIDPGVEMVFMPDAGLMIYGALNANGVVFRADANLTFRGITIDSRSADLILSNCEIYNAILGLKIVNSSFQINTLQIIRNLPYTPIAGMMVQGACNMIINNLHIDGYNPGIIFENDQRISSTPLLSNIRIRNSSSTSRTAGTGIEIRGAIALQLDHAEIDDYETGIDYDAQSYDFGRVTPLLSNIRVRNSSSTSRSSGKGIKLKNLLRVQAIYDSIIGFDEGLIIDNSELSSSSTPLLSNIRIRNSSSTSRTESTGLQLVGANNAQIDSLDIMDYTTGVEIIGQNNRAASSPLLSNIRIRNSSSTSRAPARGIKIQGSVIASLKDTDIQNCNTGILYEADPETIYAHTPLLSNIRIRNSSSTSRDDYQGIVLRNLPAVQCSLLVIYPELDPDNPGDVSGSAISIDNGSANIQRATIWGIEHGLHIMNNANAAFSQGIIWPANDDIQLTSPIYLDGGQVAVEQSNVSWIGGVYDGEGNSNVDPLFVNPGEGNFYLKLRSPLRDTGIGALPFDFDANASELEYSFAQGWNLCGVPMVLRDNENTPSSVFGEALAPFYVSPYYTSILQLNDFNIPDVLGHLVFESSGAYIVPGSLHPAVGYWVRNPNPDTATVSVEGIMDDGDYILDLPGQPSAAQGFFMLANPYDRPLTAEDMEFQGSFNSSIFIPNGSSLPPVEITDPDFEIPAWSGFIVKANEANCSMHIQYPSQAPTRIQETHSPQISNAGTSHLRWELSLKATSARHEAIVTFGIAKSALDTYDPMDVPELPFNPYPAPLSMYIQNTEWDNLNGNYIRDIKSAQGSVWQWPLLLNLDNLLVDGQFNGSVELALIPGQKIMPNYAYLIIDPNTGQSYDLESSSMLLNLAIDQYSELSDSSQYPLLLEARLDTLHSESQETTLELSNYPNPFNPSTTFAYNLPKAGRVEISLYNIKGQKVRNLLSADQDSGLHSVVWDGKDNNGSLCASGFYFCRIQSPAGSLNKKILMMK